VHRKEDRYHKKGAGLVVGEGKVSKFPGIRRGEKREQGKLSRGSPNKEVKYKRRERGYLKPRKGKGSWSRRGGYFLIRKK